MRVQFTKSSRRETRQTPPEIVNKLETILKALRNNEQLSAKYLKKLSGRNNIRDQVKRK